MKKIYFLIIISCAFILQGCYDSKEIDDMAYVTAIGIDDGTSSKFTYTLQFAVPLNISGGVETSFDVEQDSSPLYNIKIDADNLSAAFDTANDIISKEVNASHCKLIVFSSEIAKTKCGTSKNDFINRRDIRPTTNIAISKDLAYEYLDSVSSPLELNPAKYYELMFSKDYNCYSSVAFLKDFTDSSDYLIPVVSASGKEPATKGSMIFSKDKPVYTLSPYETRIYNILCGNFRHSDYATDDGKFSGTIYKNKKTAVKINKNSKNVKIELNLSGKENASLQKDIKQKSENLISVCKKNNIDILSVNKRIKKCFLTDKNYENYRFNIKDFSFDVVINYTPTIGGI